MEKAESHVFYAMGLNNSYPVLESGKGVYVYDSEGKRYLDGIGGTHVVSIGHGVEEIGEAMAEQAKKLCFANKAQFTTEVQERLAEAIAAMAPAGMNRIAFATGGSTANEIASQLAQYYYKERGKPKKQRIIGRWHSYHGRTSATLAMSGSMFVRKELVYNFDFPHIQVPHCYQCPYKLTYPSCQLACAEDLATTLEQENPDTIAAFIAEPIIGGAGSAIVPPPGYYEKIREICDAYDILFIAEEIVTGFGRTGKNFGIEHWDAIPDIISATKALSSGYAPIGAVILHDRVWTTLKNGTRKVIPTSFTYAGHPISCAAALAVQNYIAKHNLIEQCAAKGEYLKQKLTELADREPLIGDVRGKGLLIGVEFVRDRATHQPFPFNKQLTKTIVKTALDNGLIIRGRNGTGIGKDGDHILISPPFVITERECDELVEILAATIAQVKQSLNLVCAE
ncbi:aminotransferase class III-fold pyridoxal phosphate-dependent enzyme [Spirulina sp. 06S082]|uniref:aminotransferase class III-fold pyridoxal phosphate-dependent enzyme n=1 Tax=Spirulina sp. 06S082 TaxID=3110248 RepID=UPI002B221552|nr:aminotransferase class III-fold pyridoxal phosphate-dependent enzyme [Spirulina sp. 06S082]MEA5469867.1 aminotransferase class III-fold pyridoxal phosphate-dependent enzyme [Spirulina sp. 06S082]